MTDWVSGWVQTSLAGLVKMYYADLVEKTLAGWASVWVELSLAGLVELFWAGLVDKSYAGWLGDVAVWQGGYTHG